jgi:hypothetical protein
VSKFLSLIALALGAGMLSMPARDIGHAPVPVPVPTSTPDAQYVTDDDDPPTTGTIYTNKTHLLWVQAPKAFYGWEPQIYKNLMAELGETIVERDSPGVKCLDMAGFVFAVFEGEKALCDGYVITHEREGPRHIFGVYCPDFADGECHGRLDSRLEDQHYRYTYVAGRGILQINFGQKSYNGDPLKLKHGPALLENVVIR